MDIKKDLCHFDHWLHGNKLLINKDTTKQMKTKSVSNLKFTLIFSEVIIKPACKYLDLNIVPKLLFQVILIR